MSPAPHVAQRVTRCSVVHDWMSISAASQLLGVSLPTLRRWSDEGRVPSVRTLGGHRRFSRQAIKSLALLPAEAPSTTTVETALTLPEALDRQRLSDQDWRRRLSSTPVAEAVVARMRGLGQRLLGLLIQHVHSRANESQYLAEAAAVGTAYGAEAARGGVSLADTAQAFLYFRHACAHMTAPVATPSDLAETVSLHERIEAFMDAVLLGALVGYEGAAAPYRPLSPPHSTQLS
jgi:excisionase family DNA binding protein